MRPVLPHDSPPTKPHRWGRLILSMNTLVLPIVGCIYDSGQRCGEGQVLETVGSESCVCAEGYATTATGCIRCKENEVAGASGCVCKDNYGRASEQAACEPCGKNEVTGASGACECKTGFGKESPEAACKALPGGIGVSCENNATPCIDTTYSYCYSGAGTAGYCTTQGCKNNNDCTSGYMCDLTATPTYCRRPPLGAGTTCTSDEDCAGTEATFCDTTVTKSCLVQGCTLTPDNCFTGSECCDLSVYGIAQPLCVAAGECGT